jgi:hypothetical protein
MANLHQTIEPPTATRERLAPPALEMIQPEMMWADVEYREPLVRAGLDNVEAVMSTNAGKLLRALPDRENWRLELHDPHRGPRVAYLKKHHERRWHHWLRARLGIGPGATPGRIEARNAQRLEQDGIAALRLIAYGEKLHDDGLLESFLLTEELAGYAQLDHFIRKHFPTIEHGSQRDPALARLIRQVARVASAFHNRGYNHRDLYCCHFFIRPAAGDNYDVNLIDLHRVEQRRWFRRRWLVKDLAQLAYSAPRERISCKHKLAFIKQYLGVRKLRPCDKRLIRQVLAKCDFMERHLGAHP